MNIILMCIFWVFVMLILERFIDLSNIIFFILWCAFWIIIMLTIGKVLSWIFSKYEISDIPKFWIQEDRLKKKYKIIKWFYKNIISILEKNIYLEFFIVKSRLVIYAWWFKKPKAFKIFILQLILFILIFLFITKILNIYIFNYFVQILHIWFTWKRENFAVIEKIWIKIRQFFPIFRIKEKYYNSEHWDNIRENQRASKQAHRAIFLALAKLSYKQALEELVLAQKELAIALAINQGVERAKKKVELAHINLAVFAIIYIKALIKANQNN